MGKQWFEVRDLDAFLKAVPADQVVRVYRHLDLVLVDLPDAALSALVVHPEVVRVYTHRRYQPLVYPLGPIPGIPDETMEEVNAQIRVTSLHAEGLQGKGILVAAGDTGIDVTHPFFKGKQVEAMDFSGSGNTEDRVGHGTAVSYQILCVAPQTRLFFGKVFPDGQQGAPDEAIFDFLEECVRRGVKAANLSLGSSFPSDGRDPLSREVDSVAQRGCLVVIANGNSGNRAPTGSPAAARLGLAVGAVDKFDCLAFFSTDGPTADGRKKPEAYAPGVNIIMARARGTSMGEAKDERYISAPGTSFAAPPTTGLIALLLEKQPSLTPARLKELIIKGEDPIIRR